VFRNLGRRSDRLIFAGIVIQAFEGFDGLIKSSLDLCFHGKVTSKGDHGSTDIAHGRRSCFASALLMSTTATLAPACAKARAVARPIPPAAPVTKAAFPASHTKY
jgi:hypothetical protein